mgnify:CR=1 FL=1
MENVKPKEVFVDQWTAELFSNFTGVYPLIEKMRPSGHYRKIIIERAEEFIEVIARHFQGTSLNNTAEEIADHYIATAD